MSTTPVPPFVPEERDPTHVEPAVGYRSREPVWVYRHGQWHAGAVEGASPIAVMVTYQRQGMRGTVVDTVPAECLVRREEAQPAGGER
ncbi:hypothetical protein JQS43_15505 [Natronosporangium hydrolyticum]|uniref:Uncharacterized protein n=1 Tax=Natronosporangium hydrolyticum TaxID=2811111 RepID=A0A895YC85_9ACTN|nr:hypothetical protein [Natronosporangium hydrolyticum]QSB13053.1 hypothetical protein JQS43_15505 [Natronosporangium hydrolyticum]